MFCTFRPASTIVFFFRVIDPLICSDSDGQQGVDRKRTHACRLKRCGAHLFGTTAGVQRIDASTAARVEGIMWMWMSDVWSWFLHCYVPRKGLCGGPLMPEASFMRRTPSTWRTGTLLCLALAQGSLTGDPAVTPLLNFSGVHTTKEYRSPESQVSIS